jgi:alkanesulfonate monooxygenase SsuD/methylene tetrahydromethanopterin reductase-like flavin-dependent oxidoreductase (luciferase family)
MRCVLAGAGAHLASDHYTTMLRRAGVPAHPADPRAGAAAVVDAGVFVTGPPQTIADELLKLRDSGVDEVILSPGGVLTTEGTKAALQDLRDILAVS